MSGFLQKTFKICINVVTVIVIILLGIMLYGKIQMQLSGEPYASYFGYTLFQVSSGSMGESVKINDVILVKLTKEVNENDVVTFINGGNFITHRVIEKKDNVLVTKGDANNAQDIPITQNDLIGKVVYVMTGLGMWKEIFSNPKVFFSILLTFLLFDIAVSYQSKQVEKTSPSFFTRMLQKVVSFVKKKIPNKKDFGKTEILQLDEMNQTNKQRSTSSKTKRAYNTQHKNLGNTEVLDLKDIPVKKKRDIKMIDDEEKFGKTEVLNLEELQQKAIDEDDRFERTEVLRFEALAKTEVLELGDLEKTEILKLDELKNGSSK